MCAWAKLRDRNNDVPKWKATFTSRLRAIRECCAGKLVSWSFAVLVFLVILYLLFALVNSSLFYLRDTWGTLCEPSTNTSLLIGERTVSLDISNACFATGIRLESGKTYHFYASDTTVYDGDNAATADGLLTTKPKMYLFIPLRRHVTEPWIRLFGRVGETGNEHFALSVDGKLYTARADGELFLYVNDAVFGVLSEWDLPYRWEKGKNRGEIAVTVVEQEAAQHKQ